MFVIFAAENVLCRDQNEKDNYKWLQNLLVLGLQKLKKTS